MATTKRELYAALRAPEAGGKPFTKVAGSNSLNLAPTLTGGPGGSTFKRGGMEYLIASLPPVQAVMDVQIQKAYAKAQGILSNIRTAVFSFGDIRDHWVNLDTVGGRIDRTLRLTDTKNGTKGAMSIEFGREPYYVTLDDSEGGETYKVNGMTGKFILHRGFGVAPNSLGGSGGGDA
jgi:hypothetical protein